MAVLDLSLVAKPSEPTSFSYAWKDTVLYALGIGAKRDELDYLYEGRGPKVVPSFAVVPAFEPMFRLVAKAAAGGDATKITALSAQFRRPVWPGDTLVTDGWKLDGGRVALQVSVKERSENVLTNAWATLAS